MSGIVEAATHEPSRAASDGPQLRTLLLTDLVESTSLVERIGDGPAAVLFREHDRLVLELQQRWRGRLIDRSDGLLLLFERAIDGLGFALDYTRGLRTLSERDELQRHGVLLHARTGLHVGEVLTWRNSDEAVNVGAKPLEVEGLAKPFAARLMSLARPGQVLLSAVAEPLAHRAARELGERGEQLLWKSYGRWRFKGIPEAQEIYEVGEAGIAPLRAPRATAKAWRDIPLWRRPAALAAEVVLLAGLATGSWFLTRPQPAIAFAERDWVVVGDLRNLTGDKLLDDSLQQAFRISLEQSRFVNVLSDLKSRDTLALMQRKPGTALDRAIASEIALRDGARAVILPTVSEVGGRVRVSAEVIDPHTQTTVYAESADGNGPASTLGSIDTVTAALRGKLGEALESVEKTSEPLPQVSTGNLDALRAYALGQQAYAHDRYEDARRLYQHATELDPRFALAWLGEARAGYALMDLRAENARLAIVPLRKAQALRSRLAPREAAYLDGWAAEFDAPIEALGKWKLMSSLYPDYWPAQANVVIRLVRLNRFPEALAYAKRATASPYDLVGNSFDLLGRVQLGSEHYGDAATAFDKAVVLGNQDSLRRRAEVAAAEGKFASANAMLERMPGTDPVIHLELATFAIDEGRLAEARKQAGNALQFSGQDQESRRLVARFAIAVTDWLAGDAMVARKHTREVVDASLASLSVASKPDAAELIGVALSAALLAQQLQDDALAARVLTALDGHPQMTSPDLAELAAVARSRQLLESNGPGPAIALLKPLLTGHEFYQTRVALMDAYAASGQAENASEQARWLRSRRGLAYSEVGGWQCLQLLNIALGRRTASNEAAPPEATAAGNRKSR